MNERMWIINTCFQICISDTFLCTCFSYVQANYFHFKFRSLCMETEAKWCEPFLVNLMLVWIWSTSSLCFLDWNCFICIAWFKPFSIELLFTSIIITICSRLTKGTSGSDWIGLTDRPTNTDGQKHTVEYLKLDSPKKHTHVHNLKCIFVGMVLAEKL